MGFENGMLVRVVLRAVHDGDGDEQVNVLHYDLQNSVVPGEPANDPQSLADVFRDDVLPAWAALYDNVWTIEPVVVEQEKDPQNPTGARGSWTSGTPFDGSRAGGEDMPRAITAVATLRTARIGRRFTGRMFIGGIHNNSTDINGNQFGAAQQALYNTFLAAIPLQPDIATGASTSTANWCVYSRTQRAANLDPYAEHVTSYQLRTAIHWLRSRAVG